MQWKNIAQNWPAFAPRLMTKWPELEENTLLSIDGDQDKFVDYLKTRTGMDTVTAQMELADWMMGAEPADAVMDSTRDNEQISNSAQEMAVGEDALSDDKKFGDDGKAENPVGRAA
ncbi:hypothetical protein SAMN04488515_1047 [Cognatiyoonia koreensis]|uniref:Uncharacterized protein n=1 Tax=Cognatiyoonia koreensis TaxID=364200 RepID=A0A1I0P7N0_9RHOB|nr:hypothetical protein [Cognatiyoonia koreensis]SEW10113.1 hypothetical protein SAMN04488515_1047 [Cognatiyoonia koreensis]